MYIAMRKRIKRCAGAAIAALGFFGLFADALTAYGLLGELAWLGVCAGLMYVGCELAGLGNMFKFDDQREGAR